MTRCLTLFVVLTALLSPCSTASAQPGSKLFEAWKNLRKARINARGENPQRERPPLTKPLNDPAFLEEGAPELLKKAAEVKIAEDLKKNKIKAVKYLTGIGCGCYDLDDSITEALIEAASDCTEEVRMATMCALFDAANGDKCSQCGSGCCCKEAMMMQLYKMAYERDDTGAYLEPSSRVRAAAKQALRACCPGTGPIEYAEPEELPPPKKEPKEPIEKSPEDEEAIEKSPDDDGEADDDSAADDAADNDNADAGATDEDITNEQEPDIEDTDSDEDLPDPKKLLNGVDEQEVFRRQRSYDENQPFGHLRQSDIEYGVVVDLDKNLRIAHVHFKDQQLAFPNGAKLMAVVERGGKQYWMGPLTVYKSFAGSAHVTASSKMDWSQVAKGTSIISTSAQARRVRSNETRFSYATPDMQPRQPTSVANKNSTLIQPAQRVRR